jgi:hypothetical protein
MVVPVSKDNIASDSESKEESDPEITIKHPHCHTPNKKFEGGYFMINVKSKKSYLSAITIKLLLQFLPGICVGSCGFKATRDFRLQASGFRRFVPTGSCNIGRHPSSHSPSINLTNTGPVIMSTCVNEGKLSMLNRSCLPEVYCFVEGESQIHSSNLLIVEGSKS